MEQPRVGANIEKYYELEPVNYEDWLKVYPRRSAYRAAFLTYLSGELDIPQQELSEEHINSYSSVVLGEKEFASHVNLSHRHRLWPELIAASQIEPVFTFKFRTHNYAGQECIGTGRAFHINDVPKLLIASKRYDKPAGAQTIREVAAALGLGTRVIDDLLKSEKLKIQAYRDPEIAEFDEYLTPDVIRSLLLAIQRTRSR